MRTPASLPRLTFALAIAAALGSGAASALAAPARAEDAAICYPGACYRECKDNGWRGGTCVNGYCECWE